MELSIQDKQFIRNNRDLIDDGNWDKFFESYYYTKVKNIYQFIMFEAGVDLLHKMSYIPDFAFYDCEYNVGDLVIPSNVEHIYGYAFQRCRTLTSIDLSQTKIKKIPEWCFDTCENLNKVVLPKTCETVDINAFWSCSSLKSINLEEVKEIWGDSFGWCQELNQIKLNKSVRLKSGLENSVSGIFYLCSLTDITTPEEYSEEFKKEFPKANIKVI